jgi:tRNA-uridine 2-sulfurtransferase
MTKTIAVGMSGGIDSSVTAYLLKKQGFNVIGVTMAVWEGDYAHTGKSSCYGPDEQEEIEQSKKIADIIGIPFQVFDCKKNYKEIVLKYFKDEYLSGRTPNPCVVCNQKVKMNILPDLVKDAGINYDYFATGHYARIAFDEKSGRYLLKKGVDNKKDQSYFLHRLSQEQLKRTMFPLGGMTKEEIKTIARDANLPVVDKKESQDFCAGDYKELLEVSDREGDIVDKNGKILGKHKGFWNFTIGQRKGLGIGFTEALYVVELDSINNKVIVGTITDLNMKSFLVNDLNWIAFEELKQPIEATVKIRYAQRELEAKIEPYDADNIKITLLTSGEAITPGQSAVIYQDDVVVGGGFIERVI